MSKREDRTIDARKLKVYKAQYDIPEGIYNVVARNLTDIDKRNYLKYGGTFISGVTKADMVNRADFTDNFLHLIDNETKIQKGNLLRFFSFIAQFLMKLDPETRDLDKPDHIYAPANRLYFLFLANVYCNSKKYFARYDWLVQLLSIFEQTSLTGEFKIDEHLYKDLFEDCHTSGGIKSDLPFFQKWDPKTNEHINDYTIKSLSNSSLASVVALSSEPAVGWEESKAKEMQVEEEKQERKKAEQDKQTKQTYKVPIIHTATATKSKSKSRTQLLQCPHGSNCNKLKRTLQGNPIGNDEKHVRYQHKITDEMDAGGIRKIKRRHTIKRSHSIKRRHTIKRRKTHKRNNK